VLTSEDDDVLSFLTVFTAWTLALATPSDSKVSAPEPGATVPDFRLKDIHRRPRSLAGLTDQKACVIAFIDTECPHCQHLTEAIHPMAIKYAGKDVQILEIAFDTMASYIPEFNQKYNPSFPVGSAPRDKIESFMQHSVMQMFMVPQMVIIDKHFVIQKQFPAGDPAIVSAPDSLYPSIDALLSEPGKKNASSAGVHRIAKK